MRAAFLLGERRAVLGALTLTIVNALRLAMQVAVLPILARILGPSAFGLVALATPFIILASMISDAGLGNALIRERASSRELESTVFWCSLAMSLVVMLVVALLAFPAARVLSEPMLGPIIIALTAVLPIGGALAVPNARIVRDGKLGLFALGDVLGSVCSSAVAIGAALLGAGPWSLVAQQLVLWVVKASLLMPTSGFRPLMVCRPALAWPHLGFGLNAVGSSLADFANKNLPIMVIGGLIGVTAAGHYSIAYQIIRVPEMIISAPLYLTMFAAVARWGDDRVGVLPLALRGLRGLVTVLAPLFCGIALTAPLTVKVLLGPAWVASGPILALLTPAGFFLCTYTVVAAILMGLGRSEQQFRLTALNGFFLAVGTAVGAPHGGPGVAAGFSVGAALAAPAYLLVLSKLLATPVRTILGEIAAPLIATLAMAVIVIALLQQLPTMNAILELAIVALCGMISFGLVLALISGRRLWRDLQWLLAGNRDRRSDLVPSTPHANSVSGS